MKPITNAEKLKIDTQRKVEELRNLQENKPLPPNLLSITPVLDPFYVTDSNGNQVEIRYTKAQVYHQFIELMDGKCNIIKVATRQEARKYRKENKINK